MTVSYFVFYRGSADDPRGFMDNYKAMHVPIMERFPGIKEIKLHTPGDSLDVLPIEPGGFALVAELVFESAEDLTVALESPERAEAREDFKKFPPFNGDVWHQAMVTERFK